MAIHFTKSKYFVILISINFKQRIFKNMNFLKNYSNVFYIFLIFICMLPWISPPIALFTGIVFALFFNNPYPEFNKTASKYLLQFSVVGLGFSMNLYEAMKSGRSGLIFTIVSVAAVMITGWFIGRKMKLSKSTSYLISTGTAICGGSAIAAVSPIIKTDAKEISIALGTVFILNAVALFIFPPFGHFLNLSQEQFGFWSAIAIHDTSSVVGAGSAYGTEALMIATTVKLTRALWIIPMVFITSFIFKNKADKVYIPWFILFFILAMAANTFLDIPSKILDTISIVSRKGLPITLFMIGCTLSLETLKEVGIKPLLLGITLWFLIGIMSLTAIVLI